MTSYSASQIPKPLDEQDFERKAGSLFRCVLDDPNVKRVGRRGQKQFGLDLIGRRNGAADRIVGVQCKLKGEGRKLSEAEVRREVGRALRYTPKLREYFIITTAPDDTSMQRVALSLQAYQFSRGRDVAIEIWGWGTLQERINEYEAAREAFDPGFSPSAREQRHLLEAIAHSQSLLATQDQLAQISAKLDRRSASFESLLPTEFADIELKTTLRRALRRRGFIEADWLKEIGELADRVAAGNLSLASLDNRSNVLWRAAISHVLNERVEDGLRFKNQVVALLPGVTNGIFDAAFAEAHGERDRALRLLRETSSVGARGLLFIILDRANGARKALQWIDSEKLSILDFDITGALNVLVKRIEQNQFLKALSDILLLPLGHFVEAPAFHLLKANLILAMILPIDQRQLIFQGLPMNPRSIQLASDLISRAKIADARSEVGKLLAFCEELSLPVLKEALLEIDLWLKLEDPNSSAFAREVLAQEIKDPDTTLRRVRLALAYDIPFNVDALSRHLKSARDVGGWTADELFAAFLVAAYNGSADRLSRFIEENRIRLYEGGELSKAVLAGMEVESLARAGRIVEAKIRLTEVGPKFLSEAQASELKEVIDGIEDGDEAARLKSRYLKSGNLGDLRVLVAALRQKDDVQGLAEYAPSLVRETLQAADFAIALRALYREKRYPDVLKLVDDLPDLCSLDDDFRSIAAWARYQTGDLLEARKIARQLFEGRGEGIDRELAINTGIETGDWGYLQAILTREVTRLEHLDGHTAMRLARLALEAGSPYTDHFRDAALAKSPDDPEVLLSAYTLAVEQGAELKSEGPFQWLERAIELSRPGGPIRHVTMKEIVEHTQSWNQQIDRVISMLREAKVPLFVAAQGLRRKPFELWLRQVLSNASPLVPAKGQFPILAFSGARHPRDLTSIKAIAFDATAIYTLAYLGILQKALDCFDRVQIGPSTLAALFLDRQFFRVQQPSQIAKARRIQQLIISRRVRVLEASPRSSGPGVAAFDPGLAHLLTTARKNGALVVRSAPVFRLQSYLEERVDLSEYNDVLVDTRAILSFLQASGRVDAAGQRRAAAYLFRVDEGWSNDLKIGPETVLYLDELAVIYLDFVELLEPLTRAVALVYVEADVDEWARETLRNADLAEGMLTRIEQIRVTLGGAIESGKISMAPHRTGDGEERHRAGGDDLLPTLELLTDLTAVEAVVSDDRVLNIERTWSSEGHIIPTACTLDLIDLLLTKRLLSREDYRQTRTRLREAGYCFIPLDRVEILELLTAASSTDGGFSETPELRSLRENVSLPLRSDTFRSQDHRWLDLARLAIFQTLRDVWGAEPDSASIEDRANWLLDVLPDPLMWCPSPASDQSWQLAKQQFVAQVALSLLMISGEASHRTRHAKWAEESILKPLTETRPWAVAAVAEFLKAYLPRLLEADDAVS